MIDFAQLKVYYPKEITDKRVYDKYILKEYVQLMILDYLSTSAYVKKLAFIGGTNLRLIQGIDRFSEDLDFDCKDFSETEFMYMTDDVLSFLVRSGIHAVARDRSNPRLTAFRRNLHFPEWLFDLGLSGHREERFLLKIEAQDQEFAYEPELANIMRMGFFFPFPVAPKNVLCAMKLSALLSRSMGRDFYDAMFLLAGTAPDYGYLTAKCGISDKETLKNALMKAYDDADMARRSRDFAHLLFNEANAAKILMFHKFVETALS